MDGIEVEIIRIEGVDIQIEIGTDGVGMGIRIVGIGKDRLIGGGLISLWTMVGLREVGAGRTVLSGVFKSVERVCVEAIFEF